MPLRPQLASSLIPLCFASSLFAVALSCSDSSPSEDPTTGAGGLASLGPGNGDPIVAPASGGRANDDGGSGGNGPSAPPFALCETLAGPSVSTLEGESVFDDFETGARIPAGNGRMGYWYSYGDDTSTPFPPTEDWQLFSPGRAGSQYALHARGSDFTLWGSGVGTAFTQESGQTCLHDLSVYQGISFWARGSVNTTSDGVVERDRDVMRLLLVEADVTPTLEGGGCSEDAGICWDSHRVRFPIDECWRRFSFDFSEFEQDGWGQDGGELDLDELVYMNFEASAFSDWEVWIDDIEFYAGEKPEDAVDCDGGEGGAGGI